MKTTDRWACGILAVLLTGSAAAIAEAGGPSFPSGIPSKPSDLDPFNRNNNLPFYIPTPVRPPFRGNNDNSFLPVLTAPHMDREGNILCGTTNNLQDRSYVYPRQSSLTHHADGSAWWVSGYHDGGGRVNSPVRADSKYDRRAPDHFNFNPPAASAPGVPPVGMPTPGLFPPPAFAPVDLGTTQGLQRALANLGYNPGPVDGIYGFQTIAAVRAFQANNGLIVDGVAGFQTRSALQSALNRRP